MNRTIGFIGTGNMGSAMIAGVSSVCKDIYIYDHHPEKMEKLVKDYHTQIVCDEKEICEKANIIVLSIKPKHYFDTIQKIKGNIKEDTIIVCVAAGISLSKLKEYFGYEIKACKVMPNTPAMVGEAMSAISFNDMLSKDDKDCLNEMISSFGKVEEVEESLMDCVTAISGSSPAYFYMMIEAMADAACAQGMKRDQAYKFASQAMLGSAKMVLETNLHPGELKDNVCSPAGTTIEAVKSLEETGFRKSVIQAMMACFEKSKSMGK